MSSRIKSYHKQAQKEEIMTFGVQEPVRKNMYDVILDNFDISDMKTYLHRLFIVGEHSFSLKDENIVNFFNETVQKANCTFHIEKITGVLVCYTKYFIHMIEGDEDAINRQLSLLIQHKLYHKLRTVKVLVSLTHVKQRFLPEWTHYYGQPAKLLGEIKLDCSIQETGRHLYTCIRKLYSFVTQYAQDNYFHDEITSHSTRSIHEESSTVGSNMRDVDILNTSIQSLRSSVGMNKDPYRTYLPETELLDFILKNEMFQSVEDYSALYGCIIQRDIYKDRVWPVPSDFIPYDIFPTPLNIAMHLTQEQNKNLSKEELDDNILPSSSALEPDVIDSAS